MPRFARSLAVVATCLGALGCAAPDPERPNVVLVTLDTFRPDHLGINGYARQTAPFLEQLMEESAVFSRAFSTSSWTAPSTGSLFTGLYPNRHGVTEGFIAHSDRVAAAGQLNLPTSATSRASEKIRLNRLPAGAATVPELFKGAGYSTFGAAGNINIGPEIGFDRGFDRFRKLDDGTAGELAEILSGWRPEITASSPYFLYLHLNDAHEPYTPHQPWYRGGSEPARTVSAYDSEISYLDGVLEGLYRDFDWRRNTLLMVVSDHGEELGERGRFGHGFSLRQVLIRVLLVISGPDVGIPAKAIATPVSLVDVLPTLLELVDLPVPRGLDGLSLARLLGPEAAVPEAMASRTLFAQRVDRSGEEERVLWTALRMPWKLITRSDAKPRLFDLSSKPGKRSNLAGQRPDETAELLAVLDEFQRSASQLDSEQVEVELDPETLETLKSLGYVP